MQLNHLKRGFLKERITLICKENKSCSNGVKAVVKTSFNVWASILPLRTASVRYIGLVNGLNKSINDQLFKVFIRSNALNIGEKINSEYRHEKINALTWKKKEFEILYPFSPSGTEGVISETLCVLKGEVKNG